jgi:glutathione S-transferase
MGLTLVIGSKRWSSWSLRPWIALRQAGIPFDEVVVPLRRPDTRARALDYSPSGKLPVLLDGAVTVWDSLAILDYIDRRFPGAELWPDDLSALACAKSISAEMHAGFAAMRRELSMDIGADLPTPVLSDEALADIARVMALWRDARTRFGGAGPFLFGRFTIADAMYVPVATRFETYRLETQGAVDADARDYMRALLTLPAMEEWRRAARAEGSQ